MIFITPILFLTIISIVDVSNYIDIRKGIEQIVKDASYLNSFETEKLDENNTSNYLNNSLYQYKNSSAKIHDYSCVILNGFSSCSISWEYEGLPISIINILHINKIETTNKIPLQDRFL